MRRLFIAAFAVLSLSMAVHATTFYVATTGRDANRGTNASPLRTIQHAADLAQPGDTIIVPPIIQKSAILRNLSDISTIIGGFGLGAAAVNVLR